ncbi:MAG: hypothetical protein ACWA5K_03475 [bacterium]
MFQSFIWSPTNLPPGQARHRFQSVLEAQRKLYSDTFNTPTSLHIAEINHYLIGHIAMETGLSGWQSWQTGSEGGLVWNGVCESFLGRTTVGPDRVETIQTLHNNPGTVCNWDGNYFVTSWNSLQDELQLTTGAGACPGLYQAQGPDGWAAGSKGITLLELVNREVALSEAGCNIFLAYGYNYSDQTLLQHVTRVPPRTRIKIKPNEEPLLERYATLANFLDSSDLPRTRSDRLTYCAESLVSRIRRQLDHSQNPGVLITGGRDSRCIAAAAVNAGYSHPLSTGGAAGNSDVVIGQRIADALGLPHRHTKDRVPLELIEKVSDRLLLWSKLSEGTEVIRHATAYNDFVESSSIETVRPQLFHGLGGEIGRGYYYQRSTDIDLLADTNYSLCRKLLLDAADPQVSLGSEAMALIEQRYDEHTRELEGSYCNHANWLDLFFWQNSCLRWGTDMLTAKNNFYWIWAPLLDAELVRIYMLLDPEDKRSSRFIESLTNMLAPQLEALEYDHSIGSTTSSGKGIFARARTRLKKATTRFRGLDRNNNAASAFWHRLLIEQENAPWRNFVRYEVIQDRAKNAPSSELLWNAATIQYLKNTI